MDNKIKKIKKIVLTIVITLAALITVLTVFSVNKYIDTHTWATIDVYGEVHSETDDAFSQRTEYLKGDHISFGNVTLEITDIKTDGEVSFTVIRGNLYDEHRESVINDTLTKNTKSRYLLDNGTVNLMVTDSRYQ